MRRETRAIDLQKKSRKISTAYISYRGLYPEFTKKYKH